jgi:hypothetical protein
VVNEGNKRPAYKSSQVSIQVSPSDLKRLTVGEGEADLGQLISKVIDQVRVVAKSERWPLNRVEIDLYQDPEVVSWQYLVVLLVFDSPFEVANKYLKELYHNLDSFSQKLKEEEQKLFRRLVYFDIETT